MKKIFRTVLLNYSADQMYQVVNEVEQYPDFLPWCGGVEVLSRSEHDVKASVLIKKMGISQSFTTHNHVTPGRRIEMRLVDGPFSHLHGEWEFKPLGEQACKVNFEIEFKVSNGLMNMMLSRVFEQIANTLVDSFIARAQQKFAAATTLTEA